MKNGKLNVAIVGLGFGKEFIPIYQLHPQATVYAICQRTNQSLDEIGDKFGIGKCYTRFDELIQDSEVDAVHINSPIHFQVRSQPLAFEVTRSLFETARQYIESFDVYGDKASLNGR